jgi:hypothetical protein
MNATLDSLSALETTLYKEVAATTGPMEAIDLQLRAKGIYVAYQNVHQQYLTLLEQVTAPLIRLEALKRLTFLNWYSWVEPPCFTGLGELDQETVRDAYARLNTYLLRQQPDQELHWMLSYYSSWDYALLHYAEPELPALAAFVKSVDTLLPYYEQNRPEQMTNRGRMGRYWQSIGS